MSNVIAFLILILAVILGTAANSFAKSANGFTLLLPSIITSIVGIYKFNQVPDLFTIIGLILIISGVLIVNLLGKTG